jgi:hypothetical protein
MVFVSSGVKAQRGLGPPQSWGFKISGIQPGVRVPPGVRENKSGVRKIY